MAILLKNIKEVWKIGGKIDVLKLDSQGAVTSNSEFSCVARAANIIRHRAHIAAGIMGLHVKQPATSIK